MPDTMPRSQAEQDIEEKREERPESRVLRLGRTGEGVILEGDDVVGAAAERLAGDDGKVSPVDGQRVGRVTLGKRAAIVTGPEDLPRRSISDAVNIPLYAVRGHARTVNSPRQRGIAFGRVAEDQAFPQARAL